MTFCPFLCLDGYERGLVSGRYSQDFCQIYTSAHAPLYTGLHSGQEGAMMSLKERERESFNNVGLIVVLFRHRATAAFDK